MRTSRGKQQPQSAPHELRSEFAGRRESLYCAQALFRARNHRRTETISLHCTACRLDRVKYFAQPRSGVWQDTYSAEGYRPCEGNRSCGMAKNAFPQERIAGNARLAARCDEMRRVTRQTRLQP